VAKLGKVAAGRGRKPVLSKEKIDEIVDLTPNSKPAGETHWSVRTMAKKVGVSPATVQRIWAAHGLKPPLALDRTQASLPMVKGRAATTTHDYKRNGTTTLFAALDVPDPVNGYASRSKSCCAELGTCF